MWVAFAERAPAPSAVALTVVVALALGLAAGCGDDSGPTAQLTVESPGGSIGEVHLAVVAGGPNPTPLALSLSNPGTCPLDFAAATATSGGGAWLSASPPAGSLAAGGSTPLDVAVDVVSAGLAPGTYAGSLLLTGTCTSSGVPAVQSPALVGVNLTVTPASSIFRVGGSVSGLAGTGLVLQNALRTGDLVAVDEDGPYALPVPDGAGYAIVVARQPGSPDQQCTVVNGSGTVAGAEVTNVDVTCASAVQVSPLYGGPDLLWNTYVRNDGADAFSATGTPCQADDPGPWGACLHAGEVLQLTVPGVTDCAGVAATDALDAFDWVCLPGTPAVRVVSVALGPGRRLADLIDPDALTWRDNSVTVTVAGAPVAASTPAPWHSNPIVAPGFSAGTSTLIDTPYTVVVVRTDEQGTLATAVEGVAVVVVPGASLTRAGVVVPGAVSGLPGSAFLWIEGDLAGTSAERCVHLDGTTRSVVRLARCDGGSFVELAGASANLLVDDRVGRAQTALRIDAESHHETVSRWSSFSASTVGVEVLGNDNVLAQVTVANSEIGLSIGDTSSLVVASNVLLGVTAVSDDTIATRFDEAVDTTAVGLLTANMSIGVQVQPGTDAHFPDVAAANTWISATTMGTGLFLASSGATATWSGDMLVGNNARDCQIGAFGTYDCATDFDSDEVIIVTGVSLAESFVGAADGDTVNVAGGDTGTAPFLSITDWLGFENAFRGWGVEPASTPFPSQEAQGECASGTCRIWDWSLAATDAVVRDVYPAPIGADATASSHTWTAADAASCDAVRGASWDGSSCTSELLLRAIELLRDGHGNDNLLCEAGERCLVTPNLGAYQGHGGLVYVGLGGLGGDVELYRYASNGR